MIIQNKTMDEERALYALKDAKVIGCEFSGPADGESALKECRSIEVEDCKFMLRYPLWHVEKASVSRCELSDGCRAALWYDKHIQIKDSRLMGVKALRECEDVALENCEIKSAEFGWNCRGLDINNCSLEAEYAFLNCENIKLDNFRLKGKYSFQYVKHAVITNSYLDTKDAFWHCDDITVVDSVIKGEYLAWYSNNLRLVRCKIIGTQPLCYAKGLVLEDCETENADLAFENSFVNATVNGSIVSVKNPLSGSITADDIGEIILDEHLPKTADCKIVRRNPLSAS